MDLSRLRARNRTDPPARPVSVASPETPGESPESEEAQVEERAESPTVSVTTYMSRQVRARAKAAFRATAHLEDDASWSAFVERAVLAEVVRREAAYNDGARYVGDDRRLSPGRSAR
ncbi:hypothetical protein [Curtobacterium sp. MCBD17_035]|uniref:ParB family protein n=1 Tax=Curtobacterium sp. MCBD17_035 TaxID=2175673 RepID=UPI0032E8C852